MLTRVLEPELMDSIEDAREYDAMDHAAVNARFVTDLLSAFGADANARILDLGTGTAQIPIELCRRAPRVHVTAVDLNDADEIVAVCRCGRERQMIPILDLPLPSPPPAGWEWIEAYRHWARGER